MPILITHITAGYSRRYFGDFERNDKSFYPTIDTEWSMYHTDDCYVIKIKNIETNIYTYGNKFIFFRHLSDKIECLRVCPRPQSIVRNLVLG